MTLPLIDVFHEPYEAWSQREATFDEIQELMSESGKLRTKVNDKLKAHIKTAFDAAQYIANNGADNSLEAHIDSFLNSSDNFKKFRAAMPSRTPNVLFDYQQRYPNYCKNDLDSEINRIGQTLSDGQYLFHGGTWTDHSIGKKRSQLPLSTSFSPQVALKNAEWKGKAYDAGQINLFVLRAVEPKTNVFCFPIKGTKMGNEKEVLFASGATLNLRNITLVRDDFEVAQCDQPNKEVPIYVLEVDVS